MPDNAMELPSETFDIVTRSPEQTRAFGRRIGEALTRGMVLSLKGDLGCGKTVFVQGLAAGLSVPETIYVTSPSYALIHEYPGRIPLFHVDLYRIEAPGGMDDLGLYDILDDDNVVAIEWAERIVEALPPEGMRIRFETVDDDTRNIYAAAYGLRAVNVLRTLLK